MSDALVTYVEDHLAGAKSAIELLGALRDKHIGEPQGHFASDMLVEVKADEIVLEELAGRIGAVGNFKKVSAWVAEKLARLKFSHEASTELGTLEALEFLALGIQGKLALWKALMLVRPIDSRLSTLDLEQLAARAEGQWRKAEEQRLEAAKKAFFANPGSQ